MIELCDYHIMYFFALYIPIDYAYIVSLSFEASIFAPFKRGPLQFFALTVSLLF